MGERNFSAVGTLVSVVVVVVVVWGGGGGVGVRGKCGSGSPRRTRQGTEIEVIHCSSVFVIREHRPTIEVHDRHTLACAPNIYSTPRPAFSSPQHI